MFCGLQKKSSNFPPTWGYVDKESFAIFGLIYPLSDNFTRIDNGKANEGFRTFYVH